MEREILARSINQSSGQRPASRDTCPTPIQSVSFGVRTFRRHIQLHKDRIVGVTSVGETSAPLSLGHKGSTFSDNIQRGDSRADDDDDVVLYRRRTPDCHTVEHRPTTSLVLLPSTSRSAFPHAAHRPLMPASQQLSTIDRREIAD